MGQQRHRLRAARSTASAAPGDRRDGPGRDAGAGGMRQRRSFPAVAQSVPAARRFAVRALADSSAPTLEAVELMVSELATNCIRHEHASFHIAILRTPSEIRIEVTDSGAGTPTMRSPGPHE